LLSKFTKLDCPDLLEHLTDHADAFFQSSVKELLANNKFYLHKIIFLLRTACKEVDTASQKPFELHRKENRDVSLIFTKPKGRGWNSTIQYLERQIEQIDEDDLEIMVPFLMEWVNQYKIGTTTRTAGMIALHFYKLAEAGSASYPTSIDEGLLKIVLTAANELKAELTEISEVLLNGENNRRLPYDSLREMVLSDNNESLQYFLTLPEYVLKLAGKSWFQSKEGRHEFDFGGPGVEPYYSIHSNWHYSYYPASALQTPVYYLLHFKTKATIDFIIEFTNKTVEAYFHSGFDEKVQEIEVIIGDKNGKQYISPSLWSMYRGNGSPVTPYLLQSIHMALEKFFLEKMKDTETSVLVHWLRYLLINSRSASITAVVASIVLADYERLFDVAILLFRTPEFIQADNQRSIEENGVRGLYSIGASISGKSNQYHERIASCDDPHRQLTLENIALQYQYFKKEETSDEESDRRTKLIQEIIDTIYAGIPEEEASTEEAKILRLMLARIDRRKMNPIITEVNKGLKIELNPSLEPELKVMTEESKKDVDEKYKYVRLKLWANNHFDTRRFQGEYTEFEDGPATALKQTKQLVNQFNQPVSDTFRLFNGEIPGFACAAIVKKYGDQLDAEDITFCSETIKVYASAPLRDGYGYQISDGTEAAISAIPYLYKYYPEDCEEFNIILFFILLDIYPIGEYKRICDYAVEALRNSLYSISPENANKILWGYMRLQPKFNIHTKKYRGSYNTSRSKILEDFTNEYGKEFEEATFWLPVTDDKIISEMSLKMADIVFQIIPDDTNDETHLNIVRQILKTHLPVILKERDYGKQDEQNDYRLKGRFCKKYALFLLKRNLASVKEWMEPVVSSFIISRQMAQFISDILSAEDDFNGYDIFWGIWHELYPAIKSAVLNSKHYHLEEIIYNYLLAWPYWKPTAKSWRSLKPGDAKFFKKVCDEIGANTTVLYSISKFLNQVGSEFLDEGIFWIADILIKFPSLLESEISTNTIYYLEIITRKYVYLNRTKIKINGQRKEKIIVILNFLVSKASVNGYLLREEII
jgi:hypothetical protein